MICGLFAPRLKASPPLGHPVPIRFRRDYCEATYVFAPPSLGNYFFVQTFYPGGSVSPNDVYIVEASRRRLAVRPPLRSLYDTHILPDRAGAWIAVMPTPKMPWADAYRFRNGRISFALSRPRDLTWRSYEGPVADDRMNYASWMNYAATLTVQGHRKAAAEAWQAAERCARGAVREGPAGRYDAPEMQGDVRQNLREIRQRLAWIRRNEWGHWLLYRPYGWGLQVPPYRLGRVDRPISSED